MNVQRSVVSNVPFDSLPLSCLVRAPTLTPLGWLLLFLMLLVLLCALIACGQTIFALRPTLFLFYIDCFVVLAFFFILFVDLVFQVNLAQIGPTELPSVKLVLRIRKHHFFERIGDNLM
jgi:hypothetical protein